MTIERPMFPPVDPTRRRFLITAAIGSVVGAGSLAAAAMAPNDVPQAVTVPLALTLRPRGSNARLPTTSNF